MENATKALLIAAGIMLAIMIISLLLVGYNQISAYYTAKHEEKEIEQLADFNKVFQNYNREKIRGTDMLSLMNRIIDYNERLSYDDGKQYPRIQVTIDLQGHIDEFQYRGDTRTSIFYDKTRNEVITNKLGSDRVEDKNLVRITEIENELINNNQELSLTSGKLQQISSNIGNIIIDESRSNDYKQRAVDKRMEILVNILGKDKQSTINSSMDTIEDIACQYFEFTQFKRAYFDCTGTILDENTGRIEEMNFEVRTNGGEVVFN
jgi:type II secretory pathway pseudopilin PulG